MKSSRTMLESAEKVLRDPHRALPTPEAFTLSTGLKINECERLIEAERKRRTSTPTAP